MRWKAERRKGPVFGSTYFIATIAILPEEECGHQESPFQGSSVTPARRKEAATRTSFFLIGTYHLLVLACSVDDKCRNLAKSCETGSSAAELERKTADVRFPPSPHPPTPRKQHLCSDVGTETGQGALLQDNIMQTICDNSTPSVQARHRQSIDIRGK